MPKSRAKSGSNTTGGRKYSRGALAKVGKVMGEKKRGKLRSGRSGKKVTSRKQAIAIGLSEARRSGKKVPAKPSKSSSKKAKPVRGRSKRGS